MRDLSPSPWRLATVTSARMVGSVGSTLALLHPAPIPAVLTWLVTLPSQPFVVTTSSPAVLLAVSAADFSRVVKDAGPADRGSFSL